MSTRSSIKWREQTEMAPGFHLYSDCLDFEDEPPVYLRIDGVQAELSTGVDGGSLTVTLPRETAIALGLLPAPAAASDSAEGGAA